MREGDVILVRDDEDRAALVRVVVVSVDARPDGSAVLVVRPA